ncbi:olfactomedin-4 [Callorhinchus milii]|uniref:olfactomedin-4 n=1 Tax=Callorhinchus milii TaxID=7868 RepID=UPI001C3FB404|nr:olfactomedin-4 [Callorhinchus milii]
MDSGRMYTYDYQKQNITCINLQIMLHVNGTVDEKGACSCSVYLPDNIFPVQRVEQLEFTSQHLYASMQTEIVKIHEYASKIELYEKQLQNITLTVRTMEVTNIFYTELDFDLLKVEITELESLVAELKKTVNGSSVLIDRIFLEIENISIAVTLLEKFDKNNILEIRREIAALRIKLKKCEEDRSQTTNNSTNPTIEYGSCNHGELQNVNKPVVIQLNWRGFSYKYGTWGKDPSPLSEDKELYWVAPLATNARYLDAVRLHKSYDDLLLQRNFQTFTVYRGTGSGAVVYKNSMYYNCYDSADMCKLNVSSKSIVVRKTLMRATYNNRFSYSGVDWQDLDFEVDENGLWVIYSTEESSGDIVISKLNETSLDVENTWTTNLFKPAVSNAFIACGILYAVRPISTRKEEIFYTFNTKTNKEGKVSIIIDKILEKIQSLTYNPSEHKLYVYNDGYLVTYDMTFSPFA